MNALMKSLAILAMVMWVGAAHADDAAKKADKAADKSEKVADKAADKSSDAQAAGEKKPGDKAGGKGKGVRGTVLKVEGLALTVQIKGEAGVLEETVVTTDDHTIIMLDGKEGKLADLKQGQQVMVMAAHGDKPARIEAKTAGKAKEGGEKKKEGESKKEDAPK